MSFRFDFSGVPFDGSARTSSNSNKCDSCKKFLFWFYIGDLWDIFLLESLSIWKKLFTDLPVVNKKNMINISCGLKYHSLMVKFQKSVDTTVILIHSVKVSM